MVSGENPFRFVSEILLFTRNQNIWGLSVCLKILGEILGIFCQDNVIFKPAEIVSEKRLRWCFMARKCAQVFWCTRENLRHMICQVGEFIYSVPFSFLCSYCSHTIGAPSEHPYDAADIHKVEECPFFPCFSLALLLSSNCPQLFICAYSLQEWVPVNVVEAEFQFKVEQCVN